MIILKTANQWNPHSTEVDWSVLDGFEYLNYSKWQNLSEQFRLSINAYEKLLTMCAHSDLENSIHERLELIKEFVSSHDTLGKEIERDQKTNGSLAYKVNKLYFAHQKHFHHTNAEKSLFGELTTDEQFAAIFAWEKHIQLVASAGSGKTQVLVDKAVYANKVKKIQLNDILALTFNKDATKEVNNRIAQKLNINPEFVSVAKTFHSSGNQELRKIGQLSFFDEQSFLKKKTLLDDKEPRHYFQCVINDIRENDQERFETMLNDFLFEEPSLLIKPLNNALKGSNVYLFLDQNKHITIFINRKNVKNGKPLCCFLEDQSDIEATLKSLIEKIRQRLEEVHKDIETVNAYIERVKQINETYLENYDAVLMDRLINFVDLAKVDFGFTCLDFPNFEFHQKRKKVLNERLSIITSRQQSIVRSFIEIVERYNALLQKDNRYEFSDMVLGFIASLEEKRDRGYKLIMVDESQDLSPSRKAIIQGLMDSCDDDCVLFIVGDDWQTINEFAGSEITIFTEFNRYFNPLKRLYLTQNFRCPSGILRISKEFIQKNEDQIQKDVIPLERKISRLPSVFIIPYYDEISHRKAYENLFEQISKHKLDHLIKSDELLLLGRNRRTVALRSTNENQLLSEQWEKHAPASCEEQDKFIKTVHRSKGLEAKVVCLLDVDKCFPSKQESPFEKMVVEPNQDRFPYGRERRLFYVALTRTSEVLYILAEKENGTFSSSFITELLDKNGYEQDIQVC